MIFSFIEMIILKVLSLPDALVCGISDLKRKTLCQRKDLSSSGH